MKRAGFTMIELIFVIVILGILAAVALPKFIGVSEQAEAGKCKAFYGTMSRTVGPAMWSDMVLNADTAANTFTEAKLTRLIEIPTGCGTATQILTGATAGTDFSVVLSGVTYDVNNTEANTSNAPAWTWDRH